MDICRKNGIKVVEEAFTVDFMYEADEAFITATTIELVPVTKVDDKVIGEGKKGPITQKLQALFKEKIISSL